MTADSRAAAERIRAFLDVWAEEHGADSTVAGGNADVPYLFADDLSAVLDALARLTPREVICPICQRPTKLTATGLIRYHGPHSQPCKGSSILPEVPADAALAARDEAGATE